MENNNNSIKDKAFWGLIWKFAERWTAQIVSFVVSIVLARILLPDDYGEVAMILVFINIANVFVSDGFSTALIQKKDADKVDFSTMFYCSIVISIAIYALLFFTAPLIADFYNNEHLAMYLRVFAIKLPIAAVNSIQHAYVSRHMLFKKFFFSTLFGTLVSGVVGIAMAYAGCGTWALIAQYLVNSTIDTIVLFFTIKWRPSLDFSWKSGKKLLSYGWKITAGSLINSVYTELRSLVIGKVYTSSDLAYYNKGKQFPTLFVTNVNAAIGSVTFPMISNYSNDKATMKKMVRRSLTLTAYANFPIMFGLIAVAEPLMSLLLTDKWLPAVPYLRIACLTFMLSPVNTANLQMIKASGKSDLYLKLEIIKKGTGIIVLLITMKFGVMAIAISEIFVAVFSNIVNARPNKKLVDYGYLEQLKDLVPSFLLAAVMGAAAYSITFLKLNNILTLVIQVVVGVGVYLLLSLIFKIPSFYYLLDIVKDKFFKKKKSPDGGNI